MVKRKETPARLSTVHGSEVVHARANLNLVAELSRRGSDHSVPLEQGARKDRASFREGGGAGIIGTI